MGSEAQREAVWAIRREAARPARSARSQVRGSPAVRHWRHLAASRIEPRRLKRTGTGARERQEGTKAMSDDQNNIIDVEAVEVEDSDNLPAVRASSRSRMDTGAVPRWSEEWWAGVSPETRSHRCVAHKANGDRCLKLAIKGATVCRTHGGATRHVKRAARIRLENPADLMAQQLLGIALTADSEQVKLAAIRDALDRGGLKAPSEVVLSQGETRTAFETVFDSIGGDPEAAGFSSAPIGERSSAGQHASPAPAYDSYADGVKAEAGGDVTGHGDIGQQEADWPADEQAEASPRDESPRQGRPRDHDRDRGHRRSPHITGEAAIRAANEANRAIGAMADQLAIESNHKRYPRP